MTDRTNSSEIDVELIRNGLGPNWQQELPQIFGPGNAGTKPETQVDPSAERGPTNEAVPMLEGFEIVDSAPKPQDIRSYFHGDDTPEDPQDDVLESIQVLDPETGRPRYEQLVSPEGFRQEETTYDSFGGIVSQLRYHPDGSMAQRTERVTDSSRTVGGTSTQNFNPDGSPSSAMIEYDDGSKETWTYSGDGHVFTQSLSDGSSRISQFRNGMVVSDIFTDSAGRVHILPVSNLSP